MIAFQSEDMENIFDKMEVRIFLGLGSNEGDREKILGDALAQIQTLGLEVVNASSLYETEPVGHAEQDWYLNQVVEMRFGKQINLAIDETIQKHLASNPESRLSLILLSEELLRALLAIETDLGRTRTFQNAARLIDIDLLLFSDLISIKDSSSANQAGGTERLATGMVIPHPRMHLRRFVLEPMCEIAPDYVHPSLKKSFAEILAALDDKSIVRVYRKP
jgi:2-amino-4-hydroxy-6-hydroxymethyldihydropteridine diphosphokinase